MAAAYNIRDYQAEVKIVPTHAPQPLIDELNRDIRCILDTGIRHIIDTTRGRVGALKSAGLVYKYKTPNDGHYQEDICVSPRDYIKARKDHPYIYESNVQLAVTRLGYNIECLLAHVDKTGEGQLWAYHLEIVFENAVYNRTYEDDVYKTVEYKKAVKGGVTDVILHKASDVDTDSDSDDE